MFSSRDSWSACQGALVLALPLLLEMAAVSAHAGTGELCFSGGAQATLATPAVVTTISTASFPVEGIQFAVCHDTSLLIADSIDFSGTDVARVNEGKGPEFLQTVVEDGVVKVFLIVDYPVPGPDGIPAGTRNIVNVTYRMAPGAPSGTATLRFCADVVVPSLSDKDGGEVFPETCEGNVVLSGGNPQEPRFKRGEMNQDGKVNITDMIGILAYLFQGGSCKCQKAADANDDGKVDLTDAVHLGNRLFRGGPSIPEPNANCGTDATNDSLTCAEFAACKG